MPGFTSPATTRQIEYLRALGETPPARLTRIDASALIDASLRRQGLRDVSSASGDILDELFARRILTERAPAVERVTAMHLAQELVAREGISVVVAVVRSLDAAVPSCRTEAARNHLAVVCARDPLAVVIPGQRFCFTGTASRPRAQMHELVTANGGRVTDDVYGGVRYLVIGARAASGWSSGKVDRAKAMQAQGDPIRIIHERELAEAAAAGR